MYRPNARIATTRTIYGRNHDAPAIPSGTYGTVVTAYANGAFVEFDMLDNAVFVPYTVIRPTGRDEDRLNPAYDDRFATACYADTGGSPDVA